MAAGLFRVNELGKKGWEGRREERKRGGGARWKLQCFYNLIAKITCYLLLNSTGHTDQPWPSVGLDYISVNQEMGLIGVIWEAVKAGVESRQQTLAATVYLC